MKFENIKIKRLKTIVSSRHRVYDTIRLITDWFFFKFYLGVKIFWLLKKRGENLYKTKRTTFFSIYNGYLHNSRNCECISRINYYIETIIF